MFERFRRSRPVEGDAAESLAVREREEAPADEPRFARTESGAPAPGLDRDAARQDLERDGSEADASAAGEPRFERDADGDGVDDRTEARAGAPVQDRDRDGVDDRTEARDADHDGVPDEAERRREGPIVAHDTLVAMHARQRDRFGGIHWGSAFFGFLTAIGLAVILTSLATAGGLALGFSTSDVEDPGTADTIGLAGGIALLVTLAVAWFCGGYVTGRMARFDGVRQGFAVWLWTVFAVVVVAALAYVGGSEYNLFEDLNLPNVPVGDSTLTTGGAIAGGAALLVTLLAAVVGGKSGDRFHRRVDRVAARDYEPA